MYQLKVVLSSEFDNGNDVELIFKTYEEAVKYAEKIVESHYFVEITKKHKEDKEDKEMYEYIAKDIWNSDFRIYGIGHFDLSYEDYILFVEAIFSKNRSSELKTLYEDCCNKYDM